MWAFQQGGNEAPIHSQLPVFADVQAPSGLATNPTKNVHSWKPGGASVLLELKEIKGVRPAYLALLPPPMPRHLATSNFVFGGLDRYTPPVVIGANLVSGTLY